MLEQQTAMMAERDAALANLVKQNQVLTEINEELNRKVDSKSTADAKSDASTTTPKKAEKLELPSYTGAKYNGTPADFTTWSDNIKDHLTRLKVKKCIMDETFQGFDTDGQLLTGAALLKTQIETETDLQTRVGAFLIEAVKGTLQTKLHRMRTERERKPKEHRSTLTAFEIYEFIKKEANPVLAARTRDEADHEFINLTLPADADNDAVHKYIEKKRELGDFLNKTGGSEDKISDQTVIRRIIAGIKKNHEYAHRVIESSARDPDGHYQFNLLEKEVELQFPKSFKANHASHVTTPLGSTPCSICQRVHTGKCFHHPDQICEGCGKHGHHKKVCAQYKRKAEEERKISEQKKANEEKKAQKKKLEKEKRAQNRAYIATGKAVHEAAAAQAAMGAPTHGTCKSTPLPGFSLSTAQAPNAPPASPPVTVPVNVTIQSPGDCHFSSQMGAMDLGFPSDVSLNCSGQLVSKPGSNLSLISGLMHKEPPLITADTDDLTMSYTHNPTVPELDDEFNDFHGHTGDVQYSEADFTLSQNECALSNVPRNETLMTVDSAPPDPQNWAKHSFWCDGACSSPMVRDQRFVKNSIPASTAHDVRCGVGSCTPDVIGDMYLWTTRVVKLTGTNGIFTTPFPADLLSDGQLEELGLYVRRDTQSLYDPVEDTHIPLHKGGPLNRFLRWDVWVYVGPNGASHENPDTEHSGRSPLMSEVMLAQHKITYGVMHKRLSHISRWYMEKTQPLVYGFPEHALKGETMCDVGCGDGKSFRGEPTRDPDRPHRVWEPGEAVAMDTTRRMPPSAQGGTTMQIILDLGTAFLTGQLFTDKESTTTAKGALSYFKKHGVPDCWFGDGGPEYLKHFVALLDAFDIEIRRSAPNAHDQNPVEVYMRIIQQLARCDLCDSQAPIEMWADAIFNVIDVKNCTYSKRIDGIPYQAKTGRKPDITMRRRFWCPARVLIHELNGVKRPLNSTNVMRGYYVRVAIGYKAWKIWVPELKIYVISRDVTFDELPGSMPAADPTVAALPIEWLCDDTDGPDLEMNGVELPKRDPPSNTDVDIASRPDNTGKQGKYNTFNEYRASRNLELTAKGYDDWGQRRKMIGQEWTVMKQNLKKGKPTLPSDGGATVPPVSTPPVPEEGGVGSTPADKTKVPKLRPRKEWKGKGSHKNQATFISTAAKVIDTIGEEGDCITKGKLTEAGWDLLCLLVEDPGSLMEAMRGPDSDQWRKAVQAELQSLVDLEVYDAVRRRDVPKGIKLLHCKIVLKYKVYEQRYKARLVVLGFMQPDEDVGETFAPVAKFTTFRILMAIACQFDFEISSSDVKTAFLNAILKDPIYVIPPKGLDIDPDTVWRLNKCLYGLKGAPHGWNVTFHDWLIEIGFKQSPMDPCLYSAPGIWVLIWVDDALKVGTKDRVKWFETEFDKRWMGTHQDAVDMFVGVEISRDRVHRTLELTQSAYIEKFLRRFGFLESSGKNAPASTSSRITKEDCCKGCPDRLKEYQNKHFDVRAAAACMLYAAICTRPDVAYAVKELCKIMSDPGPKHVNPARHLLKYFKHTCKKGLKFTAVKEEITGTFSADLITYGSADAAYADDVDSHRSTQGFLAKLLGAAIAWFSQTQKCVTLSTTEAELYALSDAIKEVMYIRSTLDYFGFPQELPTIIYEDNAAVVATAHNPGKNHGKLKHVTVRVKNVQEHQREIKDINVVKKGTEYLEADLMTKAQGDSRHTQLSNSVLGYKQYCETACFTVY